MRGRTPVSLGIDKGLIRPELSFSRCVSVPSLCVYHVCVHVCERERERENTVCVCPSLCAYIRTCNVCVHMCVLSVHTWCSSPCTGDPVVTITAPEVALRGGELTVSATIAQDLPPVAPSGIQWFFLATDGTANCDKLTSDGFGSEIVGTDAISFSESRRVLFVDPVGYANEGCYTVRAVNTAGSDATTVQVNIEGKRRRGRERERGGGREGERERAREGEGRETERERERWRVI